MNNDTNNNHKSNCSDIEEEITEEIDLHNDDTCVDDNSSITSNTSTEKKDTKKKTPLWVWVVLVAALFAVSAAGIYISFKNIYIYMIETTEIGLHLVK